MRTLLVLLGALAALSAPGAAWALSLPEAIALAQRDNPGFAQTRAQAEAADARLAQARAMRLPSLSLAGEAGQGTTDLSGFFGFGQADVSPRAAALELRQPIFSGGAISAGVARARAGRDAALAQVGGARALLAAQVAEAYVAVISAGEILRLHEAQLRQMTEIERQAQLRFKAGEIPRTDLAQAQARLAEARAGLARASGDVARGRAHFAAVVGAEPDGLEPPAAGLALPTSLDEALASAERTSPALEAARAAARAAEADVRFTQAERLPSLGLRAAATTSRDQFFPGYRADDLMIGVQGRWTLFAGGAINARVDEAKAGARAAQSALAAARAQVREAVIGAWQDVQTSKALVEAAADQRLAAMSALESVRNEVRVGQKPTLDLLDAEREALAAQSADVATRGQSVVLGYRLMALLNAG
jgi:TolC family type I secretion outer membrane protein